MTIYIFCYSCNYSLSESKFPEKNCKFETLYLGKYLYDKSPFFGNSKTETIFYNPWKLSIWNFLLFEKNLHERDIFFKFSNSFYFPLGCGTKLILGASWDILVKFIKNYFWQLWASYERSYNCLNAVSSIKCKGCS